MDNKELTPKIRFSGFTDLWEQRKFSEVFVGLQNNTLSRADLNYNQGDIKNVHYGDVLIKFGEYIDAASAELPYINDSSIESKFTKSLLKNGDIIIADTAEDETVGKCCEITNSDGMKLLSGLHTIAVRPQQKYASKFLGYYLNSNAYHSQLLPLMQGIKVTSISKGALQDTVLTVPVNLDEQEKIGECLSHIDDIITLHQRKYEKLQNIKKSMLEKMFPRDGSNIPEVRFAGFTDPWEQRKLNEYLEVSKAKNKDEVYGKEDVLSVSGDYGIVNQIEFQGRSFAGVSVAPYGVVETGDVVYTKSPLKSNPYGIIKANKGKPGIVSTLYAVYKPLDNVSSEFVQIYFEQDSRMNNYMHPLVNKGAKNDMKVSDENALKGEVCFPSRDEQIKISEYFAKLDNLITLHQRRSFYAFIIIMVH